MSQTYATGGYTRGGYARGEETAAGGVILMAISILAAVLVIAGLAYAAGTGARHKAALAAAGCEPNLSPSGLQCTTYQVLTSQYVATVTSAMQQLNTDAAAYTASERHNLAAAESALTAILASEHALDSKLASFPFPPAVAPAAGALVRANQALATLTAEQARSPSLTQLRSFNARVGAASAAVQTEMNLTRKALDTPPTANQEP
jgi:hypothetical protein